MAFSVQFTNAIETYVTESEKKNSYCVKNYGQNFVIFEIFMDFLFSCFLFFPAVWSPFMPKI